MGVTTGGRTVINGIPYVESGLERAIAESVERGISGERSVIVVVGPKGIGKSASAVAALYSVVDRGGAEVVRADSADSADKRVEEVKRHGAIPIFYIDPTKAGYYFNPPIMKPPKLKDIMATFVKYAKRGDGVTLAVFSKDIYEVMKESVAIKKILDSAVKIDAASIVDERGVARKILEWAYAREAADRIMSAILDNFWGGYPLAAALVVRELGREYKAGEVEGAVRRAKLAAYRKVLDYLWHTMAGEDASNVERSAVFLLFEGFADEEDLGEHPSKLAGDGLGYAAIRAAVYAAAHRAFGVGDPSLCDGRESCIVVDILAKELKKYVPELPYSDVKEVTEEFKARLKRLLEPFM